MQRRVIGIKEIQKNVWHLFVTPATCVYVVAKSDHGFTIYKEIPNVIDVPNMRGEYKYRYEATVKALPKEGESLKLS
jgi:hypothetical protein